MNDISVLHTPRWNLVGLEWHMVVGNQSVAYLEPNFDPNYPQYKWLSLIKEFPDCGFHGVDFEDLESGKHALEHWWHFLKTGDRNHPDLKCKCYAFPDGIWSMAD